ncbi:glycosyl transferase GT2 family [Apostichopus japonicus]|uniref:Glycosyl transferase GT2 family n=1 Tax=Stichopus japonicus TaxID=307972 RepID=A0A2G8K6K1_STIJA|nr:glycosyl transferase GT2 family [Apostichopus japonicus]
MHSESMIGKKDCQKLLDYLKVPAKESKDIIKSDAPFSSLVHHLREAGKVSFEDIHHLMTACSDKGLSKLVAVLAVYQQAQGNRGERQKLTGRLKTTEEERQQLTGRLKTTEEERQQLKDTLKATEKERQQLTGRLKTTDEERQQFKDTLKATEEERQQLTGRLKTTEEERQQLTGRLKTTEEERQQLTGRLKASEEERQQLNDTLKATEEERQKLTGRLKTTEEEKQHFSDRLNTTENKLKTLKDEKEELLQQRKEAYIPSSSTVVPPFIEVTFEGAGKGQIKSEATKIELVKSQLEYAKEVMALQEVLKQKREALHQQALAPSASVTEERNRT